MYPDREREKKMKARKVRLINTFHSTSMVIISSDAEPYADLCYRVVGCDKVARAKLNRIRRTLCGFEGCRCLKVAEVEELTNAR